jgi:hypothetical protein
MVLGGAVTLMGLSDLLRGRGSGRLRLLTGLTILVAAIYLLVTS